MALATARNLNMFINIRVCCWEWSFVLGSTNTPVFVIHTRYLTDTQTLGELWCYSHFISLKWVAFGKFFFAHVVEMVTLVFCFYKITLVTGLSAEEGSSGRFILFSWRERILLQTWKVNLLLTVILLREYCLWFCFCCLLARWE